MEEDPLESMARECKITFSQDEKLKKCGFALESEEEDSSPPDSVQVTGIVMVSLPESNDECLDSDVFHTPPEQYRSQSMSGSEDQGPPVKTEEVVLRNDVGDFTQAEKAVDLGRDSVALGFSKLNELECDNCVIDSDPLVFAEANVVKVDGVDCVTDVICEPDLSRNITEKTVDLGKDSDTLVFSELNVIKRIHGVKDVVSDLDISRSNTERTVDLGKDSDTLLSSEMNVIKRVDSVEDVASASDLSKVECDLKGCKVLETECGQSVMNEFTEPIVIESENVQIMETEIVVNMEVEESLEEMGGRVSVNTKNVNECVEGANSAGHSAGKNIEDSDAVECASGGCVDERGRKEGVPFRFELLDSFKKPVENEGLAVPQQSLNDVRTFKDLVEAAKIFLDESTTDPDYLKAAKEGGLTFYRSRWLSQEVFDDEVMDNM